MIGRSRTQTPRLVQKPGGLRPEALKLTVVRPAQGWLAIDWVELFAYRDLLLFLVSRDLKVRYKQTVLGVSWAILQPLMTMGIFSLVFGRLVGVPSDGLPYPLFCFAGLIVWNLFIQSVINATSSVVSNRQLVEKVYFPRLVIPLSTIMAGLVDFAIAFVFLLVVMLAYGFLPSLRMLLVLPLLAIALAGALGVGSLLAAFNVRFRDIRHVTILLAQLWLFATPVIYPASIVPAKWHALLGLNPMAGVVEGFRWSMLGTDSVSWDLIALSATSSVLFLVIGLLVFRRMESSFADII